MLHYGVVDNNHDSSISVFDDNRLLFASQSERFSRVKNDPNLSVSLVDYCINTFGPPDKIHYFESPSIVRHLTTGQLDRMRTKRRVRNELQDLLGHAPVEFKDHHLCHAATGYHTSGFKDATVIVVDAVGQLDTMSIYEASEGFKKVLGSKYPHSMGLFYTAFTQLLGLTPNKDEYILMGLAALGRPVFKDRILNDFFSIFDVVPEFKIDCHKVLDWGNGLTKDQYADIAASVQSIFEDYVVELVKWARINTVSKNLVLGGGGFLNCVANSRIAELNLFDRIWINPNPGDSGSAIGAVTLEVGHIEYRDSFLGYDLGRENQVDEIVSELMKGKPVGIANGRAEFGPRALGGRSLLFDPSIPNGQSLLNQFKKRQDFRPFAPVALEHMADMYFDTLNADHRFMQYTVNVKSKHLPAITHVNHSARLQVVNDDSLLSQVLDRWFYMTGCPVLVNTSLNIKDQPIVNNEDDVARFSEEYGISVFR